MGAAVSGLPPQIWESFYILLLGLPKTEILWNIKFSFVYVSDLNFVLIYRKTYSIL